MPHLKKVGKRWRIEVYTDGHRQAKTFDTRAEAKAWAEYAIDLAKRPQNTLGEAFTRYAREVSPNKKGTRWEVLRLTAMGRDMDCAKKQMASITTPDLSEWKEQRVRQVAPSTVRREMNLLMSVFEVARKEWHWISHNPLKDVRRPKNPPARRRGITQPEIDAVCKHLGYVEGEPVTTKAQEVAVMFLIAIETAMRAGEIFNGARTGRIVTLYDTKNGKPRLVPLSPRAVELYEKINGWTITPQMRDVIFRQARDEAGLKDLRFHDSRSEALTRLSRKLDVLELAAMVGHSDPKSLLFYYSGRAEDIADKL